jgi:hypothetical protein
MTSDFDRGKFKELVLYLSERSTSDDGFGMVKLNKLLYRSDFEAFRLLGKSITGETYVKQEFGPVAADLPIILDELASAGFIRWEHPQSGRFKRDVPAATAPSDPKRFTAQELALIDHTLDELSRHGGKSVSEWSHENSVGWNVVSVSEVIPYETALLSREPLADDLLQALREVDSAA